MGGESERDAAAKPTADELERRKWEKEADFREREIKLKERELGIKEAETRPSIFKNTLFLSVAAAVVGLVAHTAGDFGTKWMQSDDENRRQQESLIQKAMEHEDPMRVIAKLKLLNEAGLIPDYSKSVKKLTDDDRGAQYFAFDPPELGAAIPGGADREGDRERRSRPGAEETAVARRRRPDPRLQQVEQDTRHIEGLARSASRHTGRRAGRHRIRGAASAAVAGSRACSAHGGSSASPAVACSNTCSAPDPVADGGTALPGTGGRRNAVARRSPDTCAGATVNLAAPGGWLFLGRMNKDKSEWVPSDSGTRSVEVRSRPARARQGPCAETAKPMPAHARRQIPA